MTSLYGAISFTPSAEQIKQHHEKILAAIAYLGDKYLLAKPVQRLT
jgi:hypothetical protein